MFRSNLFRKHFAIAALSLLAFVLIGATISVLGIQQIAGRQQSTAPLFLGRMVEEFSPQDAVQGAQKLEKLHEETEATFRFDILNEKGEVIFGNDRTLKLNPEKDLPKALHESKLLSGLKMAIPEGRVIRLRYDPPRYLFHQSNSRKLRPVPVSTFPITFGVLVITILAGVGVSLFLIFRSLREHVTMADFVISELQRGNLKARFPIHSNDEIANAKMRFNRMAQEIETLVEHLRSVEKARTELLQELTHDLRTPVASLKNMLETIFSKIPISGSLQELADLSTKEVDYISRLLEDLLLLAQVSEPMYRPLQKPMDLVALLRQEGERQEIRRHGRVKFSFSPSVREALLLGDEQLLQRMVRNLLENSFDFAKSEVRLSLDLTEGKTIQLTVSDDGPGFSEQTMAGFGVRRNQRIIVKNEDGGRLSLGLGSVIAKKVVELHRGTISVSNQQNGTTISGGKIALELPYTAVPAV